MKCEQAFGKRVDTEHLVVLHCEGSEQMFERGGAMSVALELEYEEVYPQLTLVPEAPLRVSASPRVQRRRVVLIAVVAVLLVLLMLPIRALGGKTVAGSAPTAGQEYVVRSGDTLASIATQVGGGNPSGTEQQLAAEAGSTVLVPGEHLLIP
jgi:hypothetical protein